MSITKFLKKITAVALSLTIAAACTVSATYAAPATETIPGTTRTISEFNPSFLSVTGFAKGNVNDRTEYIGTDKYVIADDELSFLKAIDDAAKGKVKVIEVTNDLDLGYRHLSDDAKACDCLSDYESNIAVALTSPAVMASGISQLLLKNIDGLTIFSRSGAAIRRAEWKLQGSSKDIVIRNIKFDGMWQWTSSTKDAGWSCMKVNGAKGVWLDHCSFTMGVDGNCDSENGASGVSYTWCCFGATTTENPDQDSTIYQTMSYMEYKYNKGELSTSDAYYTIRKGGTPFEKLLAYTAFHHKGFLIGSGDKDYKDNEALGLEDGNQRLEVTIAYSNMENLGSRVVRMRQGKGHLFNCYVNNMAHALLAKEYPGLGAAGFGINRCIDVHNGGSVAADTCVFYGVDQVMVGDEKNGAGGDWGTRFSKVYNYSMVANSKVTSTSGKEYTGSSWDNNGDNLFTSSYGWVDKSTIGKFCWNTTIVGVEDMSRENPPMPAAPFTFNYDFDYKLPYEYQLVKLDSVKDVVTANAGAYKYSEDPEFWLRTEYSANENIKPVSEATAVEGFDTNFESLMLNVDSTYQLLAEIKPSHATDRKMVFKSSDTKIAEITDSGLIIGKTPGTVDITVSSANGASKTVKVEVYYKVTGMSLNSKSKTITAGSDFQLIPEYTPENAKIKDVIWKSSDESIATVTADGLVHAIAPGKVNITCTSVDSPEKYATCRLTIKEGSGETPAPTDTPEPDTKLMGDVDLSGSVNATDALMVLKCAAKLQTLTDEQLGVADLDSNGSIDASDALIILKIAAKLI